MARWLLLAIALQLGGCGTPPPVRLHTLLGDRLPERSAAAVADGPVVSLGPIRMPAQADQPQWLLRLPDGTLALLEQERWASPPADELHAALWETLAWRWSVQDARTALPSRAAVWRLSVDVTRFESLPGREARIDSRWTLNSAAPGAAALSCLSVIREPVGEGMPALAAGHRRAMMRLGDEIGQQLAALQRGQAVSCARLEGIPSESAFGASATSVPAKPVPQ